MSHERWGENLSAEQWREIAANNLGAAVAERQLRFKAAAEERAAIVAYLDEIEGDPELQVYAAIFANRIQRGDHLNRKDG